MDWMKVPTDELLLPTRKNWEILALLKYQALYTQLEYEPNDTQMKRIFTKKEMDFVKNNRQVVEKIIKKDIESAEKNRKSSKVSYERKNEKLKENKELEKNLQADCKNNTPPEKIREDKRRQDNKERDREGAASVATPPSSKTKRFIAPTVEEVREYCQERGNSVDAERFVDFYTSKGWRIGKDPMKDWKATVRTWEKRDDYGSSGSAAVRTEAARRDDRPPEKRVGTPEWCAAERAKIAQDERAKRENLL